MTRWRCNVCLSLQRELTLEQLYTQLYHRGSLSTPLVAVLPAYSMSAKSPSSRS